MIVYLTISHVFLYLQCNPQRHRSRDLLGHQGSLGYKGYWEDPFQVSQKLDFSTVWLDWDLLCIYLNDDVVGLNFSNFNLNVLPFIEDNLESRTNIQPINDDSFLSRTLHHDLVQKPVLKHLKWCGCTPKHVPDVFHFIEYKYLSTYPSHIYIFIWCYPC